MESAPDLVFSYKYTNSYLWGVGLLTNPRINEVYILVLIMKLKFLLE